MKKLIFPILALVATVLAACATITPPAPTTSPVSLAWQPVVGPASDGVISYTVLYGTNSGTYISNAPPTTNTSITLTNLPLGTIYCVVYASGSLYGVSSISSEVSALVTWDLATPGSFIKIP